MQNSNKDNLAQDLRKPSFQMWDIGKILAYASISG
jgi:hypothetical protein